MTQKTPAKQRQQPAATKDGAVGVMPKPDTRECLKGVGGANEQQNGQTGTASDPNLSLIVQQEVESDGDKENKLPVAPRRSERAKK